MVQDWCEHGNNDVVITQIKFTNTVLAYNLDDYFLWQCLWWHSFMTQSPLPVSRK